MDFDSIFKAYDVRGVAPSQINTEVGRRIGIGFAEFAEVDRIAVGHDCRVSSPDIRDGVIEGITSRGVEVDYLGEIATDMMYYYSGVESIPGVMITASHNTSEWNGIKMCLAGAAPVGVESGLLNVKSIAIDPPSDERPRASVRSVDILSGYVDHLFTVVDAGHFKPLRVAADGGNGMAGVALHTVFDRIEADLIGLYLDLDGTFPNHPADPLRPENLVDLIALMGRENPDIGVAFDGDADRAFFIDDQRVPLPGSTTTAIIATWFLHRFPGASIVHNLICSKAVPEAIVAAGGTPVRTKVGHSFIKQVMKDSGAVFGGEHSGHYYFRDNFRADSGMLAMLVLLQVVSEAGVPLSELRKDFEPYAASGEINFDVPDKSGAIKALADSFADADQDRLDGLTVDLGDRWFNVRPSNTEPVLRLNVEAPTATEVDELVTRVSTILAKEM
ncbi:Phosphomannomutase [hydrothermal vent metagenome]|uniref:Phosphomannomutase n=1 Tax=hydrothermal vent metagenome TaxID=652676 RepID=A0A3B0SXZ9_9ZZZZ